MVRFELDSDGWTFLINGHRWVVWESSRKAGLSGRVVITMWEDRDHKYVPLKDPRLLGGRKMRLSISGAMDQMIYDHKPAGNHPIWFSDDAEETGVWIED